MNYYAYSFIRVNYSRLMPLSIDPLLMIKHNFNDVWFIHLSTKEMLHQWKITEYYARFYDAKTLIKIMPLYELDQFTDEAVELVNWFQNKNIYHEMIHSIDYNCEEFTLYFRVKEIRIILECILKNFEKFSYQKISSLDKSLFAFWKRSSDTFFLKIKFSKDWSRKICIIPCIIHEDTISFESIVDVITNIWWINLDHDVHMNLEKMYCLKHSIEYCINLQNGSVENIYFIW